MIPLSGRHQIHSLCAAVKNPDSGVHSSSVNTAAGGGEEEKKRIEELEKELEGVKGKMGENEKEHEDLLVLLEEMSEKRKKDRERIKALGGEVSEDEEEDEELEVDDDKEDKE
ncbi:uncharacterized protein MKK02DRAFT_39548 [Dioszegia hungarica]|uniref:Uso1/p115-like vesicle tethering protein C-terminal domain-containing protein n=1 Tax=Dioszegia hungarica TaxID=4972 RepID=A0AA38LWX4_9TREE|nr:uncharacterized protein MKK02DRAFT_39548 [Dioszegia hungarica]KAI9639252.1 hypothetical protein MKK02DRAFT_39548 [Dioszegia hungarica]